MECDGVPAVRYEVIFDELAADSITHNFQIVIRILYYCLLWILKE